MIKIYRDLMTGVLIRRENRNTGKRMPCKKTQTQKEGGHVNMETKTKNSWGFWKFEEASKNLSLESLPLACQHLDLRPVAPGTVKEYLSVVSTHVVCANLLQAP